MIISAFVYFPTLTGAVLSLVRVRSESVSSTSVSSFFTEIDPSEQFPVTTYLPAPVIFISGYVLNYN